MRPLVVIEGPASAVRAPLSDRVAGARLDGWRIIHGWAAPMALEQLVCTGTVASPDDARRALLAAISGAGLIVGSIADRETTGRFVDELRGLGEVEHVLAPAPLIPVARPATMPAGHRGEGDDRLGSTPGSWRTADGAEGRDRGRQPGG